jgi:hypothetical protein
MPLDDALAWYVTSSGRAASYRVPFVLPITAACVAPLDGGGRPVRRAAAEAVTGQVCCLCPVRDR